MTRWFGLIFFLSMPQFALAADCTADLTDAQNRIAAIQARDPQIDDLVKHHDIKGACAILRQNVADMTQARDNMDRCLTGTDHSEEVAELDANLADIRNAIATHCNP